MRPLLALAAALFIALAVASPNASAQQSTSSSSMERGTPTVLKSSKKRRVARAKHRHARYAALKHRTYSPCAIIDGWRAFPVRYRDSYFDTSRVCRSY
jgi:hypothetical protein